MSEDKPSPRVPPPDDARLETFIGSDGTVVHYNPSVCEVIEAGIFEGSRELFEQNMYDSAPCLVCGGPRRLHGTEIEHAFEDR